LSLPSYDATDAPPTYSAANGDIADAIRGLWRGVLFALVGSIWIHGTNVDPSVREAVQRSREFNPKFSDNGLYYFDSIDRIAAVGYQPTDQDILRSRAETTGIRETKFQVCSNFGPAPRRISDAYIGTNILQGWRSHIQAVRPQWPVVRTKKVAPLLPRREGHLVLRDFERLRPSTL
jgi:hypothetical protein